MTLEERYPCKYSTATEIFFFVNCVLNVSVTYIVNAFLFIFRVNGEKKAWKAKTVHQDLR